MHDPGDGQTDSATSVPYDKLNQPSDARVFLPSNSDLDHEFGLACNGGLLIVKPKGIDKYRLLMYLFSPMLCAI